MLRGALGDSFRQLIKWNPFAHHTPNRIDENFVKLNDSVARTWRAIPSRVASATQMDFYGENPEYSSDSMQL